MEISTEFYEFCPKCNGTGKIWDFNSFKEDQVICDRCNGDECILTEIGKQFFDMMERKVFKKKLKEMLA